MAHSAPAGAAAYDHDLTRLALEKYVANACSAGAFAASETVWSYPPPRITVDHVGSLHLPLPTRDAHDLFKFLARTAHNPAVNSTQPAKALKRQVFTAAANKVHCHNPAWQDMLDKIVSEAVSALGVDCGAKHVRAELSEMVIYGAKARIQPSPTVNRYSDRFAELVICLPSEHTGGAFTLQHGGETISVQTATASADAITWVARYTDVELKFEPLSSGFRWLLIYDLVKGPQCAEESASKLRTRKLELLYILDEWQQFGPDRSVTVVPLSNTYSVDGLKLKGMHDVDRCRVRRVLDACAERSYFEVLLANLEVRDVASRKPRDCEHHSVYSFTAVNTVDGLDLAVYCHLMCLESWITNYQDYLLLDPPNDRIVMCSNCTCGPDCIRFTANRSVIIIVPKAKATLFLLGPHGTSVRVQRLLTEIRENSMDAYGDSPCLRLHCENILRDGLADEFIGPVAVNAVLTDDIPMFAKAVEKVESGFDDNIWLELGGLIDIRAPAMPEALIIEALMKTRDISSIYYALSMFLQGLETRCQVEHRSFDLPFVRGWHDSVLLMSLDKLEQITDDVPDLLADIMLAIPDEQRFRQFIVYQGIRRFVGKSLGNVWIERRLPLVLASRLGDPYRSSRYLRPLLRIIVEATIPGSVDDRAFLYRFDDPITQVAAARILFMEVEAIHERARKAKTARAVEELPEETELMCEGGFHDTDVQMHNGGLQHANVRTSESSPQNEETPPPTAEQKYQAAIAKSFAGFKASEIDLYVYRRFKQCVSEGLDRNATSDAFPEWLINVWEDASTKEAANGIRH